jgi:ABC-type transporter Mla subunit MlaD
MPRSEFRAGLWTLSTITVAAIAILVVPGLTAEPKVTYQIRAPKDTDLSGVERGTRVLIGGLDVGSVRDIDTERTRDGTADVIIFLEIASYPPLYPQAKSRLVRDPLSGKAMLDFVDPGNPGEGRLPLQAGASVGLVDEGAAESSWLPTRTRDALAGLADRFGAVSTEWSPMIADAQTRFGGVSDDFTALRDEVGASWPALKDRVLALADRFRGLGDRFEAIRAAYGGAADEFALTRALFEEGGPYAGLQANWAGLSASWAALGEEASPAFEGVARIRDYGNRSVSRFQSLSARFRAISAELGFGPILADLSIAGDELGRVYAEVGLAPWRALLPNRSAADARRDATDEISRMLLLGTSEARAWEASLRALAAQGEPTEALTAEAAARFQAVVEELRTIESALRTWRLRQVP